MAFKKFSKAHSDLCNKNIGMNTEHGMSSDCKKEEDLNYEEWTKMLSYYRRYVDRFATDVLKVHLFPFQKFILRGMAKYPNIMLICCRGLGKSWLSALFMVCMAILYPKMKLGIASGKGQQARMVIIQKIKDELSKNPNIAREIIFPIKTGHDECVVEFKNGSSIRAVILGLNQSGDKARGWRFNIILIDEARLVPKETVERVLVPMTKTQRQNIIEMASKNPDKNIHEKGRMIYISSAYLKTCDLYQRFLHHYHNMVSGSKEYFVCSLDYKVGVQAGLFSEDDILKERDKPSMSSEEFLYEYCGIFVGSSNESYYPYEMTEKCRTIEAAELQQPKRSKSVYVISHDVATSSNKNSDNASTHVAKLKPRKNGTFIKEIVYTSTRNGLSLPEQRDMLRELVHIRFPNTEKLIIDGQSAGQGLLSMFYETWDYRDDKGQVIEYPPLIVDDDDEGYRLRDAIPMIRSIMGTSQFNAKFYPYMKSCFEDGSLRLIIPSNLADEKYKMGEMTPEEFAVHIEHDTLVQELGNIKQEHTLHGAIAYPRITKTKKRDRATSLMYLLSYVFEMEQDGKASIYDDDTSELEMLCRYTF